MSNETESSRNALMLPKSFDDVAEAVLLDEDWYEMRLLDTKLTPNGALKEFMKERGIKAKTRDALYDAAAEAHAYQNDNGQYAGLNWVLNLKTVSPDKMVNGRSFRVYLGVPNKGDDKRVTPLGQTVEDAKMERIMKHLEAFQQEVAGDSAELVPGATAMFYVVQRFSDYSQKDENTIDIGTDPMAVE